MVEFFHVFGFSISSMDVIILLTVVSSLHGMLILLCVMLCVLSLIPVSIYMFSLGVDVGNIITRFIILSSTFYWSRPFPLYLGHTVHMHNVTRRLCVLSNTKLYHRNLLFWISTKFARLVQKWNSVNFKSVRTVLRITYSHIWSLFAPIHMKRWPKVKLGQVQVEHCSESLI